MDLIANINICHDAAFTGLVAASHYVASHPLVAVTPVPVYVIRPAHSLKDVRDAASISNHARDLANDRELPVCSERADGAAMSRCAHKSDGCITVAFIGRLAPEKNPGLFIRAAAMLAPLFPDAAFVVAGDGPLRTPLEELSAQLLLTRNDTRSEGSYCGCSAAPLQFVGWVAHERMWEFLKKVQKVTDFVPTLGCCSLIVVVAG